jgi:hypothetical protein
MRSMGCLAFVLGVSLTLASQGWAGSAPWFDVRAYGAKPDSTGRCTEAINQAAKACAENGGGTVFVPASRKQLHTERQPDAVAAVK